MTDTERREAARQFYQKWVGKGNENQDCQRFWLDILQNVMGVETATDIIAFEKPVIVDGHKKMIDAYLTDTRVLIEQKSFGIPLDKKIHQSGDIDLTPYEQAKRYYDNLPYTERGRWIVTSNFSEIWIYDMDKAVPAPEKLQIINLQEQYHRLDFLIKTEATKVSEEMKVSLQAGELVGAMYDAFLKQYKDPEAEETLKSLNKLCVRIVFCLYAEDAGIFGKKSIFHDYMIQFDAKKARKGLAQLFKVLDQKPEERDPYLADDDPLLASFPYVNGGLFADEEIEIPPLTDEILDLVLRKASDDFDWSQISPTIFGAVFESTLNPETRRAGGMHYTSIENIHKVIDPLFLDDLKAELEEILNDPVKKTRDKQLRTYQDKLASLKWLDPAAGSGNFLTETYISIRRLENKAIQALYSGQMFMDLSSPIKVSIGQFYGIEINDFAVTVAKTALWIAESQMMKETEDIVLADLDFLPLKTNANIHEGNALRMNWENIIPKHELSYIMGNPPFVGVNYMSDAQRVDMDRICTDIKRGKLDYVACWYIKASHYIQNTKIRCALVSTNSITQGEQAIVLWNKLFSEGITICFSYRTFRWDSEASIKAHVHCVIIGFQAYPSSNNIIFDGNSVIQARNINAYLLDAPTVFIEERTKPLCNVTAITRGSQATDNGLYLFDPEEKEAFLKTEPRAEKYIKRFMMGREFINKIERWCLWMPDISPSELRSMPKVLERVEQVKKLRLESKNTQTRISADVPWRFGQYRAPAKHYIAFAKVSSQRRRYVPFGFLSDEVIPGDKLFTIPNATLYDFGVLTSNVHMAWMRTVCGRLKSDYSYSTTIVYNNFPWPILTEEQKAKIEQTAQGILDARALYPDSSLADLYDPLTMPPELRKAHTENDKAVMRAYGLDIRNTSEADCVAHLMKMYQELTQKENKQ